MKKFRILPEYYNTWTNEARAWVVTDAEIKRLAEEWERPEEDLLEEVEELSSDDIVTYYGRVLYYPALVPLMDDEIREELRRELAPCSNQEFYDAYCAMHEKKFGEGWYPDIEEE